MLIGQISDCHIGAKGARERLASVAASLSSLASAPDLILLSGDLANHGTEAEYRMLRDLLRPDLAGLAPVMGNHDGRQALRAVFADQMLAAGPAGHFQYVIERHDLRIIALDTVNEGSDEPEFCEARLSWLKAELKNDGPPALIAMHHPPVPCGVDWVDAEDPDWSAPLGDALAPHRERIAGIVCGHVHRTLFTMWRGIAVATAPATAPQVALDLTAREDPAYTEEPPGFLLHRWDGERLTSYAASAAGFAARTAFGAPETPEGA